MTSKPVLFLVGGAGEGGRDHVASVPHEEIAGVDAGEELFTSQFVLTTGAGATWRFTASESRSRGNWELQAGDDATAYRQFSRSVDAFGRAHELASECPPGDPDAIAAERDDLLAKLDDLYIRTAVVTADDD